MDLATAPPRALWELATHAGTEGATTTFHTRFNKHRPAERPYALGFLTRGRFLRFAQTAQGHALLQVDCSRPGAGGAGRENHIRVVCSDFFNLCVEKSKTNEVQEGDYADVGAARNMRSDTYCTFPGKRRRGTNPAATNGTESWPTGCLGFVLIRDYDALKSRGARGELTFDANHEHRVGASYGGMYTLLVTQRQLGKSANLTDGYVVLNGEAADRAHIVTRSKPKLRSVPDIVRHFNANPDLNVVSCLQ